ncbi:MAG: DUF2007 domain-containing protein [Clostridiaceae bacterium]|nr:DUF2007 domain-containing protein [Clostridiaceae bacterium]
MEEKRLNDPVKLTSAATRVEAEMMERMLEEYGIPCFIKDLESGGYMNIYMGYSVFGSEIYVREGDLKRAKSLLEEQAQTAGPEQTGDERIGNEGIGAGDINDEGMNDEDINDEDISDEDIYLSKSRAVEVIVGIMILVAAVSTVLCIALRFAAA